MGFVVVEQKRWQRVTVLFLKLEGQILHEVVKTPLVRRLLKLDVIQKLLPKVIVELKHPILS